MQPATKAAFLFPGNDIDYQETLQRIKAEETFRKNIKKVNTLAHRLNLIENDSENPIQDTEDTLANSGEGKVSELYNQMVIYTISCSICDFYKRKNIFPTAVSGYSLGIYSSLYAAESYDFETGLYIIVETFNLVKQFYDDTGLEFGMGAIVGLTRQEIMDLVFGKVKGFLEIACLNGHRSFVIVGERSSVTKSLELAQKIGALRTVRINTGFGYHTSLLKKTIERLYTFLDQCTICEPRCKILSPLHFGLVSKDAIPREIVKSLYSPVHWDSLMNAMIDIYDIREGYEVGPGESLAKMARYINQNFMVYPFSGNQYDKKEIL